MQELENGLTDLVTVYGPDKVRAAVQTLLNLDKPQELTINVSELASSCSDNLARAFYQMAQGFERNAEAAKIRRSIPSEYIPVLRPEALADTMAQLDSAIGDIIEKGKAKEEAYGEKGKDVKRKWQLEGAIKVTEATALMQIQGSGKDAFAMVNGQKFPCGTEQLKDAYRRLASAEQRNELAEVEGDIAKQDIEVFKANDAWYTVKDAGDKIAAKASLQAALLNFLAGK
jgi:hypothetical protein